MPAGVAALEPADAAPEARPVRLRLAAPASSRVAVVGDFNDWDPAATPLHRAGDSGTWIVELRLPPGVLGLLLGGALAHALEELVEGGRGRLRCRMEEWSACAAPCGIPRSPSFDRTGSSTTSKRRWSGLPSEGLSSRIPRWRFPERERSPSIFREVWITGCGSCDFRLSNRATSSTVR